MEKEELKTLLEELIANKQAKSLKELFENTPTIDIAEALEDVDDVKTLLYVIRVIGNGVGKAKYKNNPGQYKLTARQAARMDAQRKIAEYLDAC